MVLKGKKNATGADESRVVGTEKNKEINHVDRNAEINKDNNTNNDNNGENSSRVGDSSVDTLDIDKALLGANDNNDTQIFDSMSKLMEEAKSMHQKAISGSISDAERRERASGMALKFMEM